VPQLVVPFGFGFGFGALGPAVELTRARTILWTSSGPSARRSMRLKRYMIARGVIGHAEVDPHDGEGNAAA